MTRGVGAILLAGGRASRMGGIDKPGLQVDGVSLRDRAIDAVRRAGADPIVVVGPRPVHGNTAAHSDTTVQWVREDPPFTGPAAAIVAALAVTAAHDAGTDPVDGGEDAEWTFVLACDLPRVDAAVRQLVDDILLLPSDTDGACLADASSRPQWLTAVYRTAALRRAAASLPDAGRDQSMRVLVSDLAVAALPDRTDGARDIDTWEDYERFTKEVL
ncbi:molybdenum cofactor guanylyltransferase [Microbacterium sp.]|uniref:molybdenum cofactor guanylyltransferase n=1 Tax=Microbacterium sp. TaxID=51671 RepID=UPI003A92B1DD